MAMQQKAASDIITFARSTAAWEWDWQGNYSEVAAGVMRIAHDPLTKATSTTPQTLGTGSYTFEVAYQYAIGAAVRVSADANNWMVGRVTASSPTSVTILVSSPPTGAGTYSAWTLIVRRGIRVEEQRTNLLAYSSDFTSAPWSKGTGVTITPASSQAPDGSISATLVGGLQSNAGDRLFQIVTQATPVTAAGSVWLKGTPASVGQTVIFEVRRNAGTSAYTQMTVTLTAQWQRVSIALTMLPDNTGLRLILGRGTANEAYVWGAQLEVGATPSSYIPTAASQVIRAADAPNVNTLAPWFNPLEGLLVARVIRESISPSQTLVALSGTSISTILLESGAGNPAQLRMRVSVDGVQVAIPIAANSSAAYTPIKMAAAYKKDFFSVSANGAPPAEDTSGTVPVVTRLEIGSVNNAARLNGIIEDITYHPRVQDTQQASA